MTPEKEMRARRTRSQGKITSYEVYFSGDESEPSNESQSRNSSSDYPSRRRSTKEFNKPNLVAKQSQTAETLKWLSENYELIQGVCVPRCVLYTHYLDFCKKRKYTPAGPATFGKLIRQRFPKLTTRRLGTRGQSKYHYYGISIKESSPYYHTLYSGKGLTRFSGAQTTKEGITRKFYFDKKGGNSLPEFPRASEMVLDTDMSTDKVETFIIMYRTHCQRLLDTIMNANFEEVHKFLLHFWQGMPEHMIPVLQCRAVVDIIAVCDSLLYKIINDVLVPSSIQDIPDSLTAEIRSFADTFVKSLKSCLANTPDILKCKKLRVAKNFVRLLNRNMTFINLAQAARPVFLSYESMFGILAEFRRLDLRRILTELFFLTEKNNIELPILLLLVREFENLLIKQAPIEAYAEWFDNVVDEYVLKSKNYKDSNDLAKRTQTFLTNWSFITSRILEELTLRTASTFGSFQLIIMTFEEYILLIIENQMITELDAELKDSLAAHLRNTDLTETKRSFDRRDAQNPSQLNQLERQQEHQQQVRQEPQQEQLLHRPIQQEMLEQYQAVDTQQRTVGCDIQPLLNTHQIFNHQGQTQLINQPYSNGFYIPNHDGDLPTRNQYIEINTLSSAYHHNDDNVSSVQMFSPFSALCSVSEGKNSELKINFPQTESFADVKISTNLNHEDLGCVALWKNSDFVEYAKAYGQEVNHVEVRYQRHIQSRCQSQVQCQVHTEGYQQSQNHNQDYSMRSEDHGQDYHQYDSQSHHVGGILGSDRNLCHANVYEGVLDAKSERQDRVDIRPIQEASLNLSCTPLFSQNNSYRKTTLPSFYQLSSQLAGN